MIFERLNTAQTELANGLFMQFGEPKQGDKRGAFRRIKERIIFSINLRSDATFALCWALLLTLAAMFPLWQHGHRSHADFQTLCAIWFFGSLLAAFFARICSRFCTMNNPPITRFAALLFFLLIFSVLATSGLFSLQYRLYYAQWHDTFPSKYWFIQQIFTGANSFYLFVASGIEPLVRPINVILLLVICWVFKPEKANS